MGTKTADCFVPPYFDCEACRNIIAFERRLDERAGALADRAIEYGKAERERNNERWRTFARRCRRPFIGKLTFRKENRPAGLEQVPMPFEEDWFREEGRVIRQMADELERFKADDMEHWGGEHVSPATWDDPGGLYTPDRTTRKSCYEHGYTPFTPDKFDFHSGASIVFRREEEKTLVMCAQTFRLERLSNCDREHVDGKSFYYGPGQRSQGAAKSFPGFDEWRDDDYYRHHPDLRRPTP